MARTKAAAAPQTAAPAPTKPKSRKKWIVLGVILLVLIVLAGAAYMVRRSFNGPAIGTVIQSVPMKDDTTPVQLVEFDGTNFSFVHPLTFVQQTTKLNPGDIEDHVFLSTGMTSEYLTVVIAPLPSGNMNDNSAYLSRTQNPNKYQRKLVTVRNEQVTIFTSNDGQQLQQTAFWLHQGKLLTMSLTGVATDVPTAQSEFLSMVESLAWH